MSLTIEEIREFWKGLIGSRTLKRVTTKGVDPEYKVYLQYYKGKCQVVIKDGAMFNNYEVSEAQEKTTEYQKKMNITEED